MVIEIQVKLVEPDSPLSRSYILSCFVFDDVFDISARIYRWNTRPSRESISETLECFRNTIRLGMGQVIFRGPVKERILEFMPDADFTEIDRSINKPLDLYYLSRMVVLKKFRKEIQSGRVPLPKIVKDDLLERRRLLFPRVEFISRAYFPFCGHVCFSLTR